MTTEPKPIPPMPEVEKSEAVGNLVMQMYCSALESWGRAAQAEISSLASRLEAAQAERDIWRGATEKVQADRDKFQALAGELAEALGALQKEASGNVPSWVITRTDKALAAARKEVEGMGWQPIETAPCDGRWALVYRPLAEKSGDNPLSVRRLIGGNNHCWESTVPPGETPTNPTNGSCHVTLWMPIPEPDRAALNGGSGEGVV